MKYIAGNWKLNKSPAAVRDFASQMLPLIKGVSKDLQWVVFPQMLAVEAALSAFKSSPLNVGVQNFYFENEGAFTGETSATVAVEMGVRYGLIGHSERRQYFHETDETVAKKVKCALQANVTPVLCIGETLEQRLAGETSAVIQKQLAVGLAGITAESSLWVAYEPVWAIGTGRVATTEQVAEVHALIRRQLPSQNTPILYGGSVKPDNAQLLAAQPNVDGFLIGGASLNASSFFEIGKAALAASTAR